MDRDLKSTKAAAARRLPNAEASEADSRCQMPNYLDRESNIWRLTRLMLRVPLTASPAITAVSPVSIANHQREEGLHSYPFHQGIKSIVRESKRICCSVRQFECTQIRFSLPSLLADKLSSRYDGPGVQTEGSEQQRTRESVRSHDRKKEQEGKRER